jgi:hypothetical protein
MTDDGWHKLTLVSGVAFAGFSAAHLIDEFVWGAPAEFHLAESTTEILALAYMLAIIGLVVQAARGRRGGGLGLAIGGALIFAADVLKHGVEIAAPGVWRSGLVSVGLALGLTLSALLTTVAALRWWQGRPAAKGPEPR